MAPKKRGRPGYTPEQWAKKEDDFCQQMVIAGGSAKEAAKLAKWNIADVYRRRRSNKVFKAKFEAARKLGGHMLEDEARRRALQGVAEPQFYKGEPIIGDDGEQVVIRRYSDDLLKFLLRGIFPEKYRERFEQKVSGPDGEAIVPTVNIFTAGGPASPPKSDPSS